MKLTQFLKDKIYLAPVVDQLVYSFISFVFVLVLAVYSGDEEVALFSTIFAVVVFFQGIQRNSVVIPLILAKDITKGLAGRALGLQITLALLSGFISFCVWLPSGVVEAFSAIPVAFVFSLGVGGYEYIRRVLIKRKSFDWLLRLTISYVVAIVTFSVVHFLTDKIELFFVMPLSGMAVTLIFFKLIADREDLKSVSLFYHDVITNYKLVLSGLVYGFYNNILMILSPVFYSKESVAAYAVIRALMQPVQVLIGAIDSFDKNNLVKIYDVFGHKAVVARLSKMTGLIGLVSLVYGACVYWGVVMFFPVDTYVALDFVLLLTGYFVFLLFYIVGYQVENAMYIFRLDTQLLVVRVFAALFSILVFSFVVGFLGIEGVVLSMIFSWLLIAVLGGVVVYFSSQDRM